MADLDPVDQMILSRLTTVGCNLSLRDIADDDELDLDQEQIKVRLERLADQGYVRLYVAARATIEGSAALPPRVHCHRSLAA